MKNEFIDRLIWLNTFSGAFQRAKVYNPEIEITPKNRISFRNELSDEIIRVSERRYKNSINKVSSDEHIKNITMVQNKINDSYCAEILHNRHIRLGIVQKVFNLYLKFQWCLNNYNEPPHCPFDGIIIKELNNPKYYEKLDKFEFLKWTEFDDMDTYKKLVERAKKIAGPKSLAQWELETYNNLTKK